MEIHIGYTISVDRLDKLYLLLNSIKQNKRPDTVIFNHIFILYTEICNSEFCYGYFKDLCKDTDFNICYHDINVYRNQINPPTGNLIYYLRYLFPKIFRWLDRILYVDVDVACVGPGIEDFWCLPIEDFYVGAVLDPTWQYCQSYQFELQNTGTSHYFNDGIILMNLKLMREDGIDGTFRDWLLQWDHSKLRTVCYAQTLANYVLKDKVKLINVKYNNSLLASLGVAKDKYTYQFNEYGYIDPLDSIKDAVFLHFCGMNKPWNVGAAKADLNQYPYRDEAINIWNDISRRYGRTEQGG